MTPAELASARRQLENALLDLRNDGLFCVLVHRVCRDLPVSDKDIAARFGVSLPTIARWKAGTTLPHSAMRDPVYRWLIAQVDRGYVS